MKQIIPHQLVLKQIRASKRYKEWRNHIIKTQKKCVVCGIWGGGCLQAHHKKSLKQIVIEKNLISLNEAHKCPEVWDINNGMCICSHHHIELHHPNLAD